MVTVDLDTELGIAFLRPQGVLSRNDFAATAKVIDPYIERNGRLIGLIIHTRTFPGWQNFAALLSHVKFVRDHHRVIAHVAVVTDSKMGELAEHIASHFVAAEIRHYPYDNLDDARDWILTSEMD